MTALLLLLARIFLVDLVKACAEAFAAHFMRARDEVKRRRKRRG